MIGFDQAGESVFCLIDGEQIDTLTASDSAVIRGDGCFEAIRSYDGHLFRSDDHLERLARSATALGLDVPARELLNEWMRVAVADRGDCIVRIILTRGGALPGVEGQGRCLVMSHPLPPPKATLRLGPVTAPWHPAGRPWELSGVKSISYAPNMAASRLAGLAGFDDALLLSDSGVVLEGPTFSIGWAKAGRVFTPDLNLGILDSITRRVVLEIAPSIEQVRHRICDLIDADEVFAMSTVKEVTPVTAVGDAVLETGPVTVDLSHRFGLERAGTGTSH